MRLIHRYRPASKPALREPRRQLEVRAGAPARRIMFAALTSR
ncbi:hypothetical protein BSIN_3705 [Burkholderia singularis]|uniref:Uncharacterized protein n=1 Tax=Burkholderia singularis TaxID=1503053 RepID=A0A238H5R7_9BURK|nr:hypothetical protein BSIN_3705 [Burkholderia singularis]